MFDFLVPDVLNFSGHPVKFPPVTTVSFSVLFLLVKISPPKTFAETTASRKHRHRLVASLG